MFTPKPQEYSDPITGEMKKKQIKFFPDVYKDRIGKSYNDYIAGHQMNLFEDFIGYQGSAVLDEPEQKTDAISVPILQCEESENIPLPDLPEQPLFISACPSGAYPRSHGTFSFEISGINSSCSFITIS